MLTDEGQMHAANAMREAADDMKPEISKWRDGHSHDHVWALRVPDVWLVQTRFPRLGLSWYILKMIWSRQQTPESRKEQEKK